MGEAFQQRYHFNVVLRIESQISGKTKVFKSFAREKGYRFATTPSEAATLVESSFRSKNGRDKVTGRMVEYFIDQIVLRLSNEHGQVVLCTERDDMTDLLPLKPIKRLPILPKKDNAIEKASSIVYEETTHDTNFPVFKYLTTRYNTFANCPVLNVGDDLND